MELPGDTVGGTSCQDLPNGYLAEEVGYSESAGPELLEEDRDQAGQPQLIG